MTTKAEKDRQKQIEERCQNLLSQMLRDDDNKYCVDCDAKGPRWASWNLGIFLCIRCAGIHRNLGVHISKVKSVNLDSWTPEQVVSLQQMGNSRARAVYEANLPDSFRRPQTDTSLEAFIRAKYEARKYIAKEWVPPPFPKVNWDKELDEEEKARKKKREAKSTATIGSLPARKIIESNVIPQPLPKPATSPKAQQRSKGGGAASAASVNSHNSSNSASADLLGLDTPVNETGPSLSNSEDVFTNFLSAPPAPAAGGGAGQGQGKNGPGPGATGGRRSEEEENFFNQPLGGGGSGGGGPGSEKKLTTDSILALYAKNPPPPQAQAGGGGAGSFGLAAGPTAVQGVGVPYMGQAGVGVYQGYHLPNGTGMNPQGMHAGFPPPSSAIGGGLGSNPFFTGALAQQQQNRMAPSGPVGAQPQGTTLASNNLWQ